LREQPDANFAFASFDAWRYDGDSLRREFIREIAHDLQTSKALPAKFDIAEHIKSFNVDTLKTRGPRLKFDSGAILPAFAVAFVFIFLPLILGTLLLPTWFSSETTLKIVLAAFAPAAAFLVLTFHRIALPVPVQESRRRFEYPEQFIANFDELLGHIEAEQLVLGIDNLDRCTPERVSEVLATIKTFIQRPFEDGAATGSTDPETEAGSVRRLAVIIATDIDALRRHLIAQELERPGAIHNAQTENGQGKNRKDVEQLPESVRTAVDEYLRKFFDASLRITDMLDEDRYEFTAKQLRPFLKANPTISTEQGNQLVDMAAYGLRRNPRRIIQFASNLQLRMQLLSDRQRAKRIQTDPDVLVVAKLAILEEEHPEEFQELVRNPTLLPTWHQAGREENSDYRARFLEFLRHTASVRPPDVRAYLTFKQSQVEVRLPRYAEYMEAIEGSNVADVQEFVSTSDHETVQLIVDVVARRFDAQVGRGAWSSALGILRTVLEVPELQASEELVGSLLNKSLVHRGLREQLVLLDTSELLKVAGRSLGRDKADEVALALVEEIEGNPELTTRGEIVAAICSAGESLGTEPMRALGQAAGKEPLKGDFAAYVTLAGREPAVISLEAIDAAVEAIAKQDQSADIRKAALEMAAAWSEEEPADEARTARLFEAAAAALDTLRERDTDTYVFIANRLRPLAAVRRETSSIPLVAERLWESWDAMPEALRASTFDLAYQLTRASSTTDEKLGSTFGQALGDVKGARGAVEWIEKSFDEMPAGFQRGAFEFIGQLVSGSVDELDEDMLERAIDVLPFSERGEIVRQAIDVALSGDQDARAAELVTLLDERGVRDCVRHYFRQVAGHDGQVGSLDRSIVAFVVGQQSLLSEQQHARLVNVLVGALVQQQKKQQIDSLSEVVEKLVIEDPHERLEAVERLIEFEQTYITGHARRKKLLRTADALAGRPASNARTAVARRLTELREVGNDKDRKLVEELLGERQ